VPSLRDQVHWTSPPPPLPNARASSSLPGIGWANLDVVHRTLATRGIIRRVLAAPRHAATRLIPRAGAGDLPVFSMEVYASSSTISRHALR
jgi:hypothetical protein